MSEHERTISVHAPEAQAFRYLSSVANLPDFVPHLSGLREEENAHVFGIADLGEGRHREVSGFFRADQANLRLDWESDGTPGYRGWLQIAPEDGDRSRITVHISMEGAAQETQPHEPGLAPERVERTFDAVMGAVRAALENRRGARRKDRRRDPIGGAAPEVVALASADGDYRAIRTPQGRG